MMLRVACKRTTLSTRSRALKYINSQVITHRCNLHSQENRHLNIHNLVSKTSSTNSLSITDPLIIYQSYLSRGILKADQAQLRAAKEFQKLYLRVKDYIPEKDSQIRIKQLVREIESKTATKEELSKFKPVWYNTRTKSVDLVKVLSDEEELKNFPSPHGLLVNGDVGCGKSMLMDIFAQSLPHQSKGRWHYSNFMLWVYNEIHLIYERRRDTQNRASQSMISLENEFILFEVAEKMIRKNTILLLDEFMLPDLAAAKIIQMLFTYFFKLGGVLVATSNRLPEDLYATDFRKKEFSSFLRVLETRCYSLDMNSDNDYRSILSDESIANDVESNLVVGSDLQSLTKWEELLNRNIQLHQMEPTRASITVYGRELEIPWHSNGIVKFTFKEICQGLYGPGDYISLASNYHTFIICDVPILKTSMKNEARRFITLLDALYECKCKLFIQTEDHPNDLFFPDSNAVDEEANRIKVQEEEMFSKTQIALTAPYRPNISYYDDEKIVFKETEQDTSSKKSRTNDIDIDNISNSENNYANSKAFTGEDERFAYKRAVSRLKEMTSSSNWRMEGNWIPLDKSMRPWELTRAGQIKRVSLESKIIDNELNSLNGKHYNHNNDNAFNGANGVLAPVFKSVHFWSMGLWGKGNRLKDEIAKKWIKGA